MNFDLLGISHMKVSKFPKFRAVQMVKMVVVWDSKWPKLFSRKNWVAEKSWNFHIVYSHSGCPGLYCQVFWRFFSSYYHITFSEYSCAIQKDILVHGRLYATVNYLCFYANIFRWETSIALKWKDVNGLTKEKTALVIPNAIQVSFFKTKL